MQSDQLLSIYRRGSVIVEPGIEFLSKREIYCVIFNWVFDVKRLLLWNQPLTNHPSGSSTVESTYENSPKRTWLWNQPLSIRGKGRITVDSTIEYSMNQSAYRRISIDVESKLISRNIHSINFFSCIDNYGRLMLRFYLWKTKQKKILLAIKYFYPVRIFQIQSFLFYSVNLIDECQRYWHAFL